MNHERVDQAAVEGWAGELDALMQRIGLRFARSEARERAHGTAMTTMPAADASSTVPADTPSPSVGTSDVSVSGPRLLAITTSRPARSGACHRLPETSCADDSDCVGHGCRSYSDANR